MKMEPRYEIGLHPQYDREYTRRKRASRILSPETFGDEAVLKLSNRAGLSELLLALVGVEEKGHPHNGCYFFGKQLVAGKLKLAREAVQSVEAEFKRVKQSAINKGLRPPSEMPKDLLDRLHRSEAVMDVVVEEEALVRKKLAVFIAREKAERDAMVLKYGPIGTGRGDPLREVDGQKVSQDGKGVLVVDDDRSPYRGMKVVDYREHVVKPFRRQRRSGLRAINKKSLPPWPSEVPRPGAAKMKRKVKR
jgi:hypothetical protein